MLSSVSNVCLAMCAGMWGIWRVYIYRCERVVLSSRSCFSAFVISFNFDCILIGLYFVSFCVCSFSFLYFVESVQGRNVEKSPGCHSPRG